ncbi:bifunctional oligoribonuclease/PAP phosphatase NrnA [Rasiella rasia]|uniref:Bifunctional oligoribonuclease/PAP phosphatase NrnA n=1 Tax=Rasiella rasia TaxID=2744027 RepID=A0A6G6GID7_9FLAO|nr:bifunctional oligoribonuclease/PAP phosphatase NrnA [Rasiella rasia]QIE58183.1 bifunctional oligoribonuclease/PAP phosphatase NrnA [Rasiella rasia]
MKNELAHQVKQLLNTSKQIVIVGHKNPDGDAIGSCLALSQFLDQLGHKTQVIMPNDFPDFLKWMPGCQDIIIYDKQKETAEAHLTAANIVCTLDFNALDRVGEMQGALESCQATFVMIDHHQAPGAYAAVTYSDVRMSSTAEMVYHFIAGLDGLELLSPSMATNLYTGIMTDTGSFRFPATSPTTHKVIAHLMEAGANGTQIHENIYDTNTPDRLRLLGLALQNMKILEPYNAAYITLSQEELDSNNFKKGDTEGFVNYALSVLGVKFAVIFIESKQDAIVKISFRSKGAFSVNEFARTHYNGGGHTNAAGGRSNKSLQETVTEFISILPNYKNALNTNA